MGKFGMTLLKHCKLELIKSYMIILNGGWGKAQDCRKTAYIFLFSIHKQIESISL